MVNESWQAELPNFDPYSYYAGITAAFSEVVGAGVKRLALSHPYSANELAILLEPSRQIAAGYGVVTWVESDLLVTPLFPADVAVGKHVIFLAQNDEVLAEYKALKERRAQAVANGRLESGAEALAWAFGRLLSYSDAAIEVLLRQNAIG